jgi:hypothetical protein
MHSSNRKVDLNALLAGANLLVLGLIAAQAFQLGDHPYVNDLTLLLGALLCVQTQIALLLERLQRDPFVILLAFSMIFFYEFRVFTLAIWEFSDVFTRFPFNADDSNFALFYILIANLFIYGGLFSIKPKRSLHIDGDGWKATSAGSVLIVLIVGIVFSYVGVALWADGGMPRAINFIVLLLSPNVLVLMVMAYCIVYRRTLSGTAIAAIVVLVVAEMVVHTLFGSRSAILGLVQASLLVMLATWGRIKVNRGLALFGIAAVPVIVGLMVAAFAISTYNRFARERGNMPDVQRAAEFVSASTNDPLIVARLGIIAPAIAARAGFFDYSAEVIAHRDEYSAVINGATYIRSIVDNVLTPGLDLFDQPKIANSMQFIYRRWGTPSKMYVATEAYQSDQIGVYGEFFVLMGWLSLPALFTLALLLKRIYVRMSGANPYILAMKRIVVLFAFGRIIDSFGLDWMITETVSLVLAIVLYTKFFTSRPVAHAAAVEPQLATAR